jgi:hypothetical protein
MIDPLGYLLTTIRGDSAVAAITTRIRGAELASDDAPPAVVLRRLGVTRDPFGRSPKAGLQQVTIAALCFGATPAQAAQLYGAVSDAIHMKGPRKDASNRLIYLSIDESGGEATLDPETRWPTETCVINVIAAAQVVA